MEQSKALDRVRKLLERADWPGTPDEEADSARAMASDIMLKYAIDEAALDASRPVADRVKPEMIRVDVSQAGNPLWIQLADLAAIVAQHCRLRDIYFGTRNNGRYGVTVGLVGYPADLRYFQMLFTSLLLQMSRRLEPKPDLAKSFEENVYILHEAGVSYRRQVHMLFPQVDRSNDPEVKKHGGRCKTAYRRWCKKIGEEPRGITSPVNYQRNFAESYVVRIHSRFREMEQRNEKVGSALALRTESIDEMFAGKFPDMKKARKRPDLRTDWNARDAGRQAADEADLAGNHVGNATKGQIG